MSPIRSRTKAGLMPSKAWLDSATTGRGAQSVWSCRSRSSGDRLDTSWAACSGVKRLASWLTKSSSSLRYQTASSPAPASLRSSSRWNGRSPVCSPTGYQPGCSTSTGLRPMVMGYRIPSVSVTWYFPSRCETGQHGKPLLPAVRPEPPGARLAPAAQPLPLTLSRGKRKSRLQNSHVMTMSPSTIMWSRSSTGKPSRMPARRAREQRQP